LGLTIVFPLWLYYDFVALTNATGYDAKSVLVCFNIVCFLLLIDDDDDDDDDVCRSIYFAWDVFIFYKVNCVLRGAAMMNLTRGIVFFFADLSAFTVLSFVSPLTYTIGSAGKRIFVIVSAVLWFGNRVTWLNAVGVAISLCGVLLYNQARFNEAQRHARNNNNKKFDV
jgi:hypothetical protein